MSEQRPRETTRQRSSRLSLESDRIVRLGNALGRQSDEALRQMGHGLEEPRPSAETDEQRDQRMADEREIRDELASATDDVESSGPSARDLE